MVKEEGAYGGIDDPNSIYAEGGEEALMNTSSNWQLDTAARRNLDIEYRYAPSHSLWNCRSARSHRGAILTANHLRLSVSRLSLESERQILTLQYSWLALNISYPNILSSLSIEFSFFVALLPHGNTLL